MENSNEQKVINANGTFDNGFLCGKSLYLYCLGSIPTASYIRRLEDRKI